MVPGNRTEMGNSMFKEKEYEYQEPVPGKWEEPEPVSFNMRVAILLAGILLLGAVAYLASPAWDPGLIRGAIACAAVATYIVNDVFSGPRWIYWLSGTGIVLLGSSFLVW